MAIGGFDVFIDLQLTGRIIFERQRLTLLNGHFIFCQPGQQFRRQPCQFEHTLNMTATVTQLGADLLRCHALRRKVAEGVDLLSRMHREVFIVLDEGNQPGHLVADALDRHPILAVNFLFAGEQVKPLAPTTSRRDARFSVRHRVDNQILQQPHGFNGGGHTAYAGLRVRNNTDIQRRSD